MVVGPMKRRMILSGLIGFMIMFVITIILGIVGYKLYDNQNKKIKELELSKKDVMIVNRDIESKEEVTKFDFTKKQIDAQSVPNGAILDELALSEVLGNKSYARIDLKQGMVLTGDMIYQEESMEKDIRIQEINTVLLPSQLEEGDYIDIRFMLPTGSDYVVISKARVIKATEKTIWLNLDEIERLRMSSANIESFLTEGTLLYAIEYADAPQQEPATVTYDVLTSVMSILRVSPNVADTIAKNNEILLDEGYTARREMFDLLVKDYLIRNTEEDKTIVSNKINEKISELIAEQQKEREAKLETVAAEEAAAAATQY